MAILWARKVNEFPNPSVYVPRILLTCLFPVGSRADVPLHIGKPHGGGQRKQTRVRFQTPFRGLAQNRLRFSQPAALAQEFAFDAIQVQLREEFTVSLGNT